ncbi:MAG: penicillin-binding protein, partial [Alteripontixanthobacter sp.]
HSEMESMLRRAINQGTGRAATLPTPNYGKTGTSQNNRDALFVGYAGEGEDRLVVGVWIGNDDNSPLDGISGGGLPARIWRDFMRRAQGLDDRRAPPPIPRADPSGPVEPLDVPELDDIPLGDGRSRMRIDGDSGVTIETELEDIPLDIVIDEGGLRVEEGRRQNGREPAR